MTPPSVIIRQILINEGLLSTSGDWTVYNAFLPDKPQKSACIYDEDGKQDGRLMATGERIDHPAVQVRVRCQAYMEGWEKANLIAEKLDQINRLEIAVPDDGTYLLQSVSRTGTVISAGMETIGDERRFNFTVNANLTITKL